MIVYRESAAGVAPEQLAGFFVGWPRPPAPDVHLELLRGSDHVVLAVEEETERVVGFVTAVSDGVLSAYVPLLEVLPEHQGRGLGSELMRRLLARLESVYMVDLCCDAALVPFYERLGLRRWDAGMGLRRPEAIPGPRQAAEES
jgi:ribosomal protein S18 acetylase RimI-like enzyme